MFRGDFKSLLLTLKAHFGLSPSMWSDPYHDVRQCLDRDPRAKHFFCYRGMASDQRWQSLCGQSVWSVQQAAWGNQVKKIIDLFKTSSHTFIHEPFLILFDSSYCFTVFGLNKVSNLFHNIFIWCEKKNDIWIMFLPSAAQVIEVNSHCVSRVYCLKVCLFFKWCNKWYL